MDPFEVRMQFLTLLRRLNASQLSIQKVVTYALKYFSRCGDDLWDCIVEECQKGTINARINILYLLDSLCEASLLSKSNSNIAGSLYVDYVSKDLGRIVDYVVPEGREGLINLMSAVQILVNWRNKRIIDPQKVDEVLAKLDARKTSMHEDGAAESAASANDASLSRNEIFKRIEEDRERHKRLRERRWVQPISHNPSSHLLTQLASFMPDTEDADGESELTLDIEFDNEWETTSDWNEDDDEAVDEENQLCYQTPITARIGKI